MKRFILVLSALFASLFVFVGCVDDTIGYSEIDTENKQSKVIPFTVKAFSEPNTRVSISFSLNYYFEPKDSLDIIGYESHGYVKGRLGIVSGGGNEATFQGELTYFTYTSAWHGDPDPNMILTARLVSARNKLENYDYTSAITDDLEQAVQQYSLFEAESTFGEKTFHLVQKSSFVEYSLTLDSELANGRYPARVTNNKKWDTLAQGEVPVTGGKAKFYVAFLGDKELQYPLVILNDVVFRWGGGHSILEKNTFYKVSKKYNNEFPSLLETPLTFQGKNDGMIYIINPLKLKFKYSINGGNKKEVSDEQIGIDIFAGECIQLYGDNDSYYNYNAVPREQIGCTNDVYIFGNVMSLIDSDSFPEVKELEADYTFCELFADYTTAHIYNHPEMDLLLPATKLTKACYSSMFLGCDLTRAPKLPAVELQDYCYSHMFEGNSIEATPDLPSEKLAPDCYFQMFYNCKPLSRVSKLPAMELVDYCYASMFGGCENLKTVPRDMLPATTIAASCYLSMFSGCSSLVSPPDLPATDLERHPEGTYIGVAPNSWCYQEMFANCTSLKIAPELPATNLSYGCYRYMFVGCTSLTDAPELPATTVDAYCYQHMFAGCTNLTSAPVLPASGQLQLACYDGMFLDCTSLAEAPALPSNKLSNYCYADMFSGCTSLSDAPALPAPRVASSCYRGMFSGCTGLKTAPELPATTLISHVMNTPAKNCYENMFLGCTALTTAPALPSTILTDYCYQRMFKDCTSLMVAPDLPAEEIAVGAYVSMFEGCTNLNRIKCTASTLNPSGLTDWMKGVASSGTFVHASGVDWPEGDSGIPAGWTAVDAE